jgi:hypothetical protein
MALQDKVKLVVVRAASPDVDTELGVYPSKSQAMVVFNQLIRQADVLKAFVRPVEAEPNEENSTSYERGTR